MSAGCRELRRLVVCRAAAPCFVVYSGCSARLGLGPCLLPESSEWLTLLRRCPAGYAAAIVFVMIVMLLYHIQVDIEMPFDEKGLDDVSC